MSMIKATRNGEEREFTPEVWKELPESKYGWKHQKTEDIPEEVKELIKEKESKPKKK